MRLQVASFRDVPDLVPRFPALFAGACRGLPARTSLLLCLLAAALSPACWSQPGASASGQAAIPAPDHLYTTWTGSMEADKCASIWLIVRRLDPKARFEFSPRGSRIARGATFEVPFAALERAPGKSLFETLLVRLPDAELPLLRMARILHDLEINTWGKKITEEAAGIDLVIRGLDTGTEDDQERVRRALIVFDALYAAMAKASKGYDK